MLCSAAIRTTSVGSATLSMWTNRSYSRFDGATQNSARVLALTFVEDAVFGPHRHADQVTRRWPSWSWPSSQRSNSPSSTRMNSSWSGWKCGGTKVPGGNSVSKANDAADNCTGL